MSTVAIGKVLSANDLGNTGSHQVGIYINKDPHILGFFPALDPGTLNPQVEIDFDHDLDGTRYTLKFVYYNNELHTPDGDRNEYRLTRMTEFFRAAGMSEGDTLVLYRDGGQYHISDRPPLGGVVPTDRNWAVVSTG